jgi:hypothetical protein
VALVDTTAAAKHPAKAITTSLFFVIASAIFQRPAAPPGTQSGQQAKRPGSVEWLATGLTKIAYQYSLLQDAISSVEAQLEAHELILRSGDPSIRVPSHSQLQAWVRGACVDAPHASCHAPQDSPVT